MKPRLVDEHQIGEVVEIRFESGPGSPWHPGKVVGCQHPGVWVQLNDDTMWYVTNRQHIRSETREEF